MIVDQGTPADRAVRDLPAAGRPARRLHRRLRGDGRHDRPHEKGTVADRAGHPHERPADEPAARRSSDFAKAYDGPPTDPKVFEEQQKKLQDELQKRAEDARKRLESQQPPAAR